MEILISIFNVLIKKNLNTFFYFEYFLHKNYLSEVVYHRIFGDDIIYRSPISQASIQTQRGGAYQMVEALVHITTTVISGCIVALFTHWLRTRNNKKK